MSDPLARNDHAIQARLPDLIDHAYSRTAIELFEFEQVRPVYLAQGFLRVRFNPPSTRLVGNGSNASVAVIIAIEPGSAFTWNGVTWSGNTVILSPELNGLVTLKPGDPADEMKIEPIWEAVHDDYARRGYLDATVTPHGQFDDTAKRVSYTATISEGPEFRMGKLVLTGLSIEGERRIRAAWRIEPGAVFDKDVYDDFISSGIKEAFTGLPFHYEKVGRFLQEDPKAATVDVLLTSNNSSPSVIAERCPVLFLLREAPDTQRRSSLRFAFTWVGARHAVPGKDTWRDVGHSPGCTGKAPHRGQPISFAWGHAPAAECGVRRLARRFLPPGLARACSSHCRPDAPARADCCAASRIATTVPTWILTVSATRRAYPPPARSPREPLFVAHIRKPTHLSAPVLPS